jgi:hypothetical protein
MTDISLPAGIAGTTFQPPIGLRVSRVLERAGSVLSRNFSLFAAASAIAAAPTNMASSMPGSQSGPAGAAMLGLWLLGTVLGVFRDAIIVHGAFSDLRGRPFDLMESFRVSLQRFLPLLLLELLVGLSVGLGLLAFIVPAVLMVVMWYLAFPACIIEGRGALSSMGRSAELTRGRRWKIFGLLAVVVLLAIGAFVANGVVASTSRAISGETGAFMATTLVSGIISAFTTICMTVVYHELRVAEEGNNV